MVFSQVDSPVVPAVPTVLGYVEPEPLDVGRGSLPIPVGTKGTAFEHAIAFESRRTCHLQEADQFQLLAQKWEALISIDYRAFGIGLDIEHLPYAERVQTVMDVLGGKSVATIRQRFTQLSKFAKWATSEAKRPAFPVIGELIKNCVRHLRSQEGTHSMFVGFQEVLRFAKHVVGLSWQLEAFKSAWVAGVIRSAAQRRTLRKQPTTLTVSALQFLETLLEDEAVPPVDRYATGVILFAVYARARFGDLRKISYIILDSSDNSGTEHLRYLEMHSASHKMRATGNRLGAHLPLIAPLKGLGTSSWGKTFIKVAAQVGLDLTKWTPLTPLLPAPNAIGDWTSRATTSGETGRWIRHLLNGSNFDTNGFTPHGCKATTLAMLARYGG